MHRPAAPSRASSRPAAVQGWAWRYQQWSGSVARPRGCAKARGLTQQQVCHQQQPAGWQQQPSEVDPYQWMQDDPEKLLALLKEENQRTAQVLASCRHLLQDLLQQLNAWHLAQALSGPLLPSPSPSPTTPPASGASVPPSSASQPSQPAHAPPSGPHPSHQQQQQQPSAAAASRPPARHTWPDLLPTAVGPVPCRTTITYQPTTSLQGCTAGRQLFTTTSSSSGGRVGPWWVHGVWDQQQDIHRQEDPPQQQQQRQQHLMGAGPNCIDCEQAPAWRLLLDEATLAAGQRLTSSREDLMHALAVSPDGSYLAVTHTGRVLLPPEAPSIQVLQPCTEVAGAAAAAAAASGGTTTAAAGGGEGAEGEAAAASAGNGCKLLVIEVATGRVVEQLGGCAGPILWAPPPAPSTTSAAAAGAAAVGATRAALSGAAGGGGEGAAHAKAADRGQLLQVEQRGQHADPSQQQHLLILSAARDGVWCLTLTPSLAGTPQSPLVTPPPSPPSAAAAVGPDVPPEEAHVDDHQGGVLQLVHQDPYSVYCSIQQRGQTTLVVDHAPDGQPVAVHCWRPDWQASSSGGSGSIRHSSRSDSTSSNRSSSSNSNATMSNSSSSSAGHSPAHPGAWQALVPPDDSARLGVSLWHDWVLLRRHSPTHPAGQLLVAHLGQQPLQVAPLDLPHTPAAATTAAAAATTATAAGAAAATPAAVAEGAGGCWPPWCVAVLLPPEDTCYTPQAGPAESAGRLSPGGPLLPPLPAESAGCQGPLRPPLPPYLVVLCRRQAPGATLGMGGSAGQVEEVLHSDPGTSSTSSSSRCGSGSSSSSRGGSGSGCDRGGGVLLAGGSSSCGQPLGELVARLYTCCQGSAVNPAAPATPWQLELLVEQDIQLPAPSYHLHSVTWCEVTGELQLGYSSLTVPPTQLTVPLLQLPAAGSGAQTLRPLATGIACAAAAGGGSSSRREERVCLVPSEWEGLLPDLHQEVVTAVSPDGTLVPITIAYHQPQQGSKAEALASSTSRSSGCGGSDGSSGVGSSSSSRHTEAVTRAPRPCLLHSYGFYGLSEDLSFDPVNLQLLAAGWVVAVAHCRGGGSGGRAWAAAGAGGNKGRALDDLQAAAAHLLQSGITAHGQLCLTSSSAGCALVLSALLRPHPALARGAVAAALLLVPAADNLGPLLRRGEGAFELGDPTTDPQVAAAVASWDPYQLLLQLQANHPHNPPSGATSPPPPPPSAAAQPDPQQGAGGASWLLPDVMLCAGLYDTAAPPSDAAKVAALLRATAAARWQQQEEAGGAQEAATTPGQQQQQQEGPQQEEDHGHKQQQQGLQRVVVRVVPGGHSSFSGVPQEGAIQAAFLLAAVGRRQQQLGGGGRVERGGGGG